MRFRSIQVKIISVILAVLTVGVSFSISFALRNQQKNLIEASQQTLALNTQVLNHTINNIMLSGEAPLANRTMNDLRNMPEFLEYEIYRRDGTIAFSDYETLDFVNRFQNRFMFEQTPRIDGTMLEDQGFKEVLKFSTPYVFLDEGAQEMEYYFPILNYADCRSCHGDDHFIRGISHFRISLADIYAKVGAARKTLSLFFLVIGLFIFAGITLVLRRIIIAPILGIGSIVSRVGEGDLEVSVDLRQRDELGVLAGRINNMIRGLKASKELELENTRIEARLDESRKYLDNINEGLLLLDQDFRITSEYSAFLTSLFEQNDLGGKSFPDFIYPDEEKSQEAREEMRGFLRIMFNNSTAALSMIMDINPLAEKEIILPSGRKIIVSAAFQRIMEDGEVRNLMVLFQDMTGIIESREALEAERQIHESELEQIAAILKLGPHIFEEFVASAREVFYYIRENRENFGRQEILNKAFRDTHSLKGTARYLKFNVMEQLAHRMESDFAALRDNTGSDPPLAELDERLENLEEELKSIDGIIERFRQFSRGGGSEAPEMDIFRLRLEEMCDDLSRELEKEVRLDFHSDWDRLPGLPRVQASVFHLLRNAMDHGIEDSFERLAAGKEETARLSLSFRKEEGDMMLVELKDDGRGLDFQALEQRALETGLLKPGKHFPSQILKTLFIPGFSSRNQANSISGRGVGLDAVRADMQALGGKINVKTAKGRGTSFNLLIPLASLEAE